MRFGPVAVAEAEGAVLAHGVKLPDGKLGKGRVLNADDVARLRAAGIGEVTAASFDHDDVPEDEAALRLAAASAGDNVRVEEPATGRANLFAEAAGVVVVDGPRVDRLNAVHEALTLATLPAFEPVEPGRMAATVKIIPFAAPAGALEEALAVLREGGPLLRVAPYRPLRVRLIQTELPSITAKALDKTVRVTAERIEAVGGDLVGESRTPHEAAALAREIGRVRAAGDDLLLIAGASAITDRRDVLPAAIIAAGGRVAHFGMPVDPGNLLLLADLGGRPVLGLPGCARSPKLNGFDWVLQRLASGLPVGRAEIVGMGVGGLLTEIPSRPRPRREPPRPVEGPPRITALVLAAGSSRRMGARNKLLLPFDGKPLVAHAVDAALASDAAEVVVVTGHEAEGVRAALAGRDVRFVHNPDHARGLAGSLNRGLDALDDRADGVLVCLGDMPRVGADRLDRLIAAFAPAEGRGIVVPVAGERRGNPVLWARAYVPLMRRLTGDTGARTLIAEHPEAVAEVMIDDDGPLADVDTPEALAALQGAGRGSAA